jgi:hypothetical protein
MIGDIILYFKRCNKEWKEFKILLKESYIEWKESENTVFSVIKNSIKLWWKQLICTHEYEKTKTFYGYFYFCKKCDRTKIKENPYWYL